MAISAHSVEADSGQALLRVFLTIAAVWLVFWGLIGGMFLTVAGPGLTLIGETRLLCLAVFAPPAALLILGLIGAETLSRLTPPARSDDDGPRTRRIDIGRD